MRAREIVFVVLVILIGLSIQSVVGFHPWKYFQVEGVRLGDKYREFAENKEQAVEPALPIRIENRYGDLWIRGWDQPRASVQLRKRVYLNDEIKAKAVADKIHIVIESKGGETVIRSNRDECGLSPNMVQTDLEITIPQALVVRTVGTHGDVKIEGLKTGGLDMRVSYGDLSLQNTTGETKVTNEHSDITVKGLQGGLTLENGYNDVSLIGVTGDVKAKNDHGDVHVEQIGGSVQLQADYGDVIIKSVAKDVVCTGDHSEVKVIDCPGNVDVQNSYEDLIVENVGGKVQVKGEHSPLSFKKIAGELKASTNYESVEGASFKGPVQIDAEHSSVELRDLSSDCAVRTSYEDVSILDFDGKIDLHNSRGSCELRARGAVSAPISIRADYGDVQLALPRGARFQLIAETLSGDVAISYPLVDVSRSEKNQLVHVTGSSSGGTANRGPMVEIRASYGDISVNARGGSDAEHDTGSSGE